MNVVRKNQAKIFKNSEVCTAIEYPAEGGNINGAVIELTGRYPETGSVMNERCSDMLFLAREAFLSTNRKPKCFKVMRSLLLRGRNTFGMAR